MVVGRLTKLSASKEAFFKLLEQRALKLLVALAAKEGRPDLAGAASILAGKRLNFTVRDMGKIMKAIAAAKEKADLRLLPDSGRRLGMGHGDGCKLREHADGSFQGAVGVIADKRLPQGRRARCSLIWWKSGKVEEEGELHLGGRGPSR